MSLKKRIVMNAKVDKTAITKIKIEEAQNDFVYWQSKSYEERLATLESIREEYNKWKYGNQQGFQRVYSVVKPK